MEHHRSSTEPDASLAAGPDWAHHFHIPTPGPYALTHSVGCLPKSTGEAFEEGYLRPWQHHGGDAWAHWLAQIDAFRTNLAGLFGGSANEYCPQTNLSSALTKVLSALPEAGASNQTNRRTLLAAEDAFPSLGYVLQQQARRGYELKLIPRDQDPALPETWKQALTRDTAAVLVTHVHSNTGVVSPVQAIARLCRERDILCIVDIAQSAGILPLDLPKLGAHVALGSCVKWLCGGPGAGFLWVDPSLLPKLEPLDVGWFSHADPFEMDIHSFIYAPDARRFWGGTPSIAPFVVANASLKLIRQVGVPAILAHNRRLMEAFGQHLEPEWRARLPQGEIGGTLCIPTGSKFEDIHRSLRAAQVRFDSRKDVVRLSFHLCNTFEDVRTLAQAWNGGH